MDFDCAQDIVNHCYKSLRQVSLMAQRLLEEGTMVETLLPHIENVQNSLIKLSRFLLDNLALTTVSSSSSVKESDHVSTDRATVEWFLSNALVVMINLGWAGVSTSYKCLELLAVMTTNSRKTWLISVSGSSLTLEPLRLSYEAHEMFRNIADEIMEKITAVLKKADKKSPAHKAVKVAYRGKLNHLAAALADLKKEGEPMKRRATVASELIRGVGGVVTGGVVSVTGGTTDTKKEPKF